MKAELEKTRMNEEINCRDVKWKKEEKRESKNERRIKKFRKRK
jgi:hypothetical protein